MRIFVHTATYELSVSRKSHLRDHPSQQYRFAGCISLHHKECGRAGCISFHPLQYSMHLQGVSLCTTSSMDVQGVSFPLPVL
jgi:hypothetical protein